MSDILSQKELDALLSIDVDDDFILHDKSYNVKEELQIPLQQFHTAYKDIARSLGVQLSQIIHSIVNVKLYSVEKMRYDEFLMLLSQTANLTLFDVNSLGNSGIIEVNNSIGFSIIDILLGGDGKSVFSDREFSQIEYNLFKIALNTIVGTLSSISQLDMTISSKVSISDIISSFVQDDIVTVCTMEVNIKDTIGMINICLPNSLSQTFLQSTDTDEILVSKVPFEVDVGRVELTLDEILDLKINDIIEISEFTDEIAKIYVDDKYKFSGEIGSIGTNKSVCILQDNKEVFIDE